MISEIHALNPNTVSRSFWKRTSCKIQKEVPWRRKAGFSSGTRHFMRAYSINDFYMGCAYVCLYKVDTAVEDERRIGELTLTFAAARYPRKLIAHLTKERGYSVEEAEQGIYYVKGAFVPIQILVLSKLSEKENLWLRVLSNELKGKEIAGRALSEYRKHQNNGLYSSVIDIMIRANRKRFVKEGSVMSEEFESLLNEKLAMREERGRSIGLREGKLAEKQATVRNLKKINMPVEQIAEIVEESLETVEQWLAGAS